MAQDIWECCECGDVFFSKERREPPLCWFCLHHPGWMGHAPGRVIHARLAGERYPDEPKITDEDFE